jgi:hypothetical protein
MIALGAFHQVICCSATIEKDSFTYQEFDGDMVAKETQNATTILSSRY